MNNTMNSTYVKSLTHSTLQDEFNAFLTINMDYLASTAPYNPSLSPDDEWRTDDYSEYDRIRGLIKD